MTAVVVTVVAASPRSWSTSGTLLPGFSSAFLATVATSIAVVFDRASRSATIATTHFVEEAVELVLGAAHPALGTISVAVVVAPRLSGLALGTIASHVTSLPADTTDDTSSVVLLLGTIVLAMTDLSTVLTGLVLVVTEGTVESGELTKLVTLELVLSFGNGSSLSHVSRNTS